MAAAVVCSGMLGMVASGVLIAPLTALLSRFIKVLETLTGFRMRKPTIMVVCWQFRVPTRLNYFTEGWSKWEGVQSFKVLNG